MIDEGALNSFAQRVHAACIAVGNEIGGRIQDSLHASLNIPYPPASRPGERPHRRKGYLAGGVSYRVTESASGVEVLIESTRPQEDPRVPRWLEKGRAEPPLAPRPYVEPERREWEAALPQILPELIRKHL